MTKISNYPDILRCKEDINVKQVLAKQGHGNTEKILMSVPIYKRFTRIKRTMLSSKKNQKNVRLILMKIFLFNNKNKKCYKI